MMIVIRAEVPKEDARQIKVRHVVVVDPKGTWRQLKVLNAYLDDPEGHHPSVEIVD